MNNPKISVIIPIYNVEEYIENTLNCLLDQTFIDDIEVLMIDDGSSDNSRYIIEKYALDYENFHAIHNKNEGISIARNIGIDLAKGEYIHFLDSDDYIIPDSYEKLYRIAKNNHSDIVTTYSMRLRRYNITDSLIFKKGYKNINENLNSITLENMPSELLWDAFVWNKLFKKEFIDKHSLKFIPHMLYEDIPFSLKAFALANTISVSKDIFYYWRIRGNENSSITQQHEEFSNFKSRLKMIHESCNILNNYNFNDRLKNELYFRWIDYDLMIYLKKFHLIEEEYHVEMIEDTNKILKVIPTELFEKLNSIKKITYNMVKEKDIEGLKYFSEMEKDLKKNPHIPERLEKYERYIDFEKDAIQEDLVVKLNGITTDKSNIYIEFRESINYLPDDYQHETSAELVDQNENKYALEIKDERIIIPINLIKEKEHLKIKMEYVASDFKKEGYLRNNKRRAIKCEGFDIEIGIGTNRHLIIDLRETNDIEIKIENIVFEDDEFNFNGFSNEKIENGYIENVVNFEKIKFPIESNKVSDDKFDINFSISYKDILSEPIRKWEIKVEDKFKTINVTKKFEFYKQHNKIYIINARNKLLISDDFYNIFNTLDEKSRRNLDLNNKINLLEDENTNIKNENKQLIEDNTTLKNENKKLNNKIKEYKSRFAVKISDKMKNI